MNKNNFKAMGEIRIEKPTHHTHILKIYKKSVLPESLKDFELPERTIVSVRTKPQANPVEFEIMIKGDKAYIYDPQECRDAEVFSMLRSCINEFLLKGAYFFEVIGGEEKENMSRNGGDDG
jgi:hypothetical protein